ncbi:putative sporulation protein YtxC [Paenibacillus albiflavus]|uniref:Putative sporulation protein YtxC n=1 Tax=Paenibacillus albiflavus TaxID=2545760 RepID=A0A4R4E4U7_9BACL|nr:putative sporulation protein YtxC [Paenibacillus albiflavus]TCZ73031.1 putative sporulation protein YtxC [Paenibacillus albiflavus]
MKLLSIIVKPSKSYVSKLYERITTELGNLHNGSILETIHCQSFDHYEQITIHANLLGDDSKELEVQIIDAVSIALAQHIIHEETSGILEDIITKEFHYRDVEELTQIKQYCTQFLNGSSDSPHDLEQSKVRRVLKMSTHLHQYIMENRVLNLKGFTRFRLDDYMEEMREIVEYAIDEFMMERQYKEFIALLKYFVYIQEAKISVVHLLHKGGHEFTILNDKMQPVDINRFESSLTTDFLEKDMNFEDMIVSTLITVSPANIYIHTKEPELPIIKTIMQIFEDRTEVCSHCPVCHRFFGEILRY